MNISVIIPALNEAEGLSRLLPELAGKSCVSEIIVVNDASTDKTLQVCEQNNATILNHHYRMGNGACIKHGARQAKHDVLLFMDADCQHPAELLELLVEKIEMGYDMAVGARNPDSHATGGRKLANSLFNCFASWVTGHPIRDLTSGYRAVKRDKFLEFLRILPNGFSYPTTITMAFFRSGYSVAYVSFDAAASSSDSHIHPLKDGIRFLIIIFKVATLYTPLKLFFPMSIFFFSTGLIYYLYTFLTQGRFTNMGMLFFITSVLVFLIGIISEQITQLLFIYNNKNKL
ncbi:MAG: glycosyltransferase family 2 protein [Thiotrichales bacterium]|nr:glycosyltransferase family 2 protein [Thiotrichales bacterium]